MSGARYRVFLLSRYRILGGYAGVLLSVVGLVILSPVALLPFYPAQTHLAAAFLVPGLA